MQMKISKKQILRVVAFVMALCLICFSFVGCGKEKANNAYRSISEVNIGSQILASNSNYELSWDSDAKAVIYKNVGGTFWSDIFYQEYLDSGKVGTSGKSPISITVFNTKTLDWTTISSDAEMGTAGSIVCKKIDGGIRVTYFFDTYQIAVPIDYMLKDDHINVSIDSSKILEDGVDYKLVSVSLAQNMCAIKNTDENGFLVVPSGNGALMSVKESALGTLSYEAPVYGRDVASRIPMSRKDDQEARLPIFGSYSNGKGMLGIVEEGKGSAVIKAEAGNNRVGYSNVYVDMYVRGYDSFMYEYFGQDVWKITKRVNEDISGQVLTVAFYPLYGEDADYNGMAKKYRSYLIEKGELKKSTANASPYSVTFLGGTNTTQSFFGIPYQRIDALTTFSQAEEILKKLKAQNGVLPQVRLLGYSDNGLRAGSIAGGSRYPSVYGSKKELNSLNEFCKDTNLFLDFDIVNYTKSGNGFSLSFDVAKTAILYDAENYPTTPTRKNDENNVYYILGRDSLIKAGNKALNKANKYSAKAVSFSSLGYSAFSDYNDNKYINRNEIEKDVASIISAAKEKDYVTAVADANSYAACAADILFDTAATSGNYDAFYCDIPLYQMIFHSYKPMYSEGANISDNYDEVVAKSVAYGMGIGYYLTDGYVDKSDDLDEYKLYATIFEDNAENINNTLQKDGFMKQYSAVADSALVKYELIDGVAKSSFENGVVIYTNLSSKAAQSPIGELQPYEFRIG